MNDSAMDAEPAICATGGKGLWLPVFGDDEQEWPRGIRVVLYMLGLFWCFIGVAIIADVFMAAIEKVTSKKIQIMDKEKKRLVTYEIWNPTVANLTLMALGSSAPEIMLNVIDIFAKEFYLEGLGPSTIVGSAAFNMLMIIAVCIIAIPDGDRRTIKEMPVYIITAVFSVLAYIWLLIILMGTSPNVVEVWEGILTFLFFPILCILAWIADKGYLGGDSKPKKTALEDMTPDEFKAAEEDVRQRHGQDLTPSQVERILQAEEVKVTSRAVYRVGATRQMFGGKRVHMPEMKGGMTKAFLSSSSKVAPNPKEVPVSTFQFQVPKMAVMENKGEVKMVVIRDGDLSFPARVSYKTRDGKATQGKDYVDTAGILEFAKDCAEKEIAVTIIDDPNHEPDEEFYVELSEPKADDKIVPLGLGAQGTIAIVIIDNDDPGQIAFEHETMEVEQKEEDYEIQVKVCRENGAKGDIEVAYKTEEDTAKAGRDFEEASGTLAFANEQSEAFITVTIKAAREHESKDFFRLILSDPTNGATINAATDGGEEKNFLTITIQGGEEPEKRVRRIKSNLAVAWDKSKVGHSNWAAQFKNALYVNGDDDGEDGPKEPPSFQDKAMHLVAVPWKLLFAVVPPTDYCGGWLCFFCALAMIGVVTIVIGDMASLLGCVMCIPDDITAITFVALGTSLPDTFASKTAAISDPTADAAVGNVTGSNSVNVFLGLGLPWMIAALYWHSAPNEEKWFARYGSADGLDFLGSGASRQQGFVVQAGSLGFSVTVFSICAVSCLALLQVRRMYFGGELGGDRIMKKVSAAVLVLLWMVYIILSSWKSLQENSGGCA